MPNQNTSNKIIPLMEKTKNLLFFAILITLPFNLRHIFNFQAISLLEGFRENLSFSLYLFDIFFISLAIISIIQIIFSKETKKKKIKDFFKNKKFPIFFAITFILILFLSAFLSQNKIIAFYNSFRILEVIIFLAIAKNFLKNRLVFQKSIWLIFLSGIFQSLIAFFQFVFQKSIGLKILGESIISPNILGVAKFEILGEKIIRAYGTFPHPNLLGAFLLLCLFCGIWIFFNTQNNKISSKKLFTKIGILMIFIGILLSFSRSVWLASFLSFLAFFILIFRQKNFFQKKIPPIRLPYALPILIVFAFILFLISPRLCLTNCPGDQSFTLRKIYTSHSLEIINQNPFFGIGAGNFTLYLPALNENLAPWEIQPVHNLFLLITSEIGLLGLAIFLFYVLSVFSKNIHSIFHSFSIKKNIPSLENPTAHLSTNLNTNKHSFSDFPFQKTSSPIFLIIFSAFLFLGLFDHYFWTLPQGQFLFSLALVFFNNK